MPIYEYRCELCGEEIETSQRISDPPLSTCPACGEEGLRRLISRTSFVLKGGGWYVTDYKSRPTDSSSSSPSSTSTATPASKPADSGTTSGPAKPATSSD